MVSMINTRFVGPKEGGMVLFSNIGVGIESGWFSSFFTFLFFGGLIIRRVRYFMINKWMCGWHEWNKTLLQ